MFWNVKICVREMCFIAAVPKIFLKPYNLYQFRYSCGPHSSLSTADATSLFLHTFARRHV